MLAALTGTGLAASAGLNAYIPLLLMGLLARYTDLVTLPDGWQWLGNEWVLGILAVLLVIEVVADKVPVLDHVNDIAQTAVRPTAGGLAFGAGSGSETGAIGNSGEFFGSPQWVPILAGVVIALGVHVAKAASRPVINAMTGGIGGPVASTAEDATSIVVSLAAILLPIMIVVFLVAWVWFTIWLFRRRRRRRRERSAVRAPV